MHSRERFLAALRGDALDRPPVWLMRQAGRYLPGYRALRAEHSFWDVCQKPELSTRAALEPLDRYALDAAIVFSDILVIPLAMGLGVSFGKGEGPIIARPLRSGADYDAWQLDGVLSRIDYLPRAVAHLKQTLEDDRRLYVEVFRENEFYASQSEMLGQILNFVAVFIAGVMAVGAVFGAINTMYAAVSSRAPGSGGAQSVARTKGSCLEARSPSVWSRERASR